MEVERGGGELTPYEVAAVQCGGCGGSWVTGARSQEDRRWREIPPGRQEREGITHTRGSYLHGGGLLQPHVDPG